MLILTVSTFPQSDSAGRLQRWKFYFLWATGANLALKMEGSVWGILIPKYLKLKASTHFSENVICNLKIP